MPVASQTQTQTRTPDAQVLKLRGAHTPKTDAFPELDREGFHVIPSVIDAEKAEAYKQRMFQWLEDFDLGFKRDDPSTWDVEKLPFHHRGGLYNRHGVNHEQFAWDIRTEQALIDVFAKIWGTDELLVSFDASNISIPLPASQLQDGGAPWPHVDQSPLRRFKHCVQGIMNLAENGPDDGGLMVLRGSFALYNEFFEAHEDEAPEGGWSLKDSYHHTESQLQWFYDRGCKWEKVCAHPGDVILWDSRCIHYGAPPKARNPRVATYVCYKPAADIEPEMLAIKQDLARKQLGSSHDPNLFRLTGAVEAASAVPEGERMSPLVPAVLGDRALQLAGLKAY